MKLSGDPTLEKAEALLMMPDLFNFWLTGVKACEFSDATTTQFYDPRQRDWARPLLEKLSLPTHILQSVVQPGTVLGPLLPEIGEEAGLAEVPVIAPACHDTGSAVAAVPAKGEGFAYISSGTWSLMGVESPEPVISKDSLAFNFTNEGGVCGTFRLLKNIMGLWLVQECRAEWVRQGRTYTFAELTHMAAQAPEFKSLVDPNAGSFVAPGDMPARLARFCATTEQPVPVTPGEFVRCALESLALRYRQTLDEIERITGRSIQVLHLVGGGSQNDLLNQFTANAANRPVITGPVEATALGNIIGQGLATGQIRDLWEARSIIRNSFATREYLPADTPAWEQAYRRYRGLLQRPG
jgi:rhamnulokinase